MTEPNNDATGATSKRVAAIDCGTNSIRLLVADYDAATGQLHDLVRTMEIVRLGQGVDKTKRLAPEALERTFRALDGFQESIAELKPEAVRFVATSASRDAENSDEFMAGVKERLGIEPAVISGGQEAEFSFTGAINSLGPEIDAQDGGAGAWPAIVVDIGGGSTECVLGSLQAGVQAAFSADIGCVRITERCLQSDPPTAEEIANARQVIGKALDEVNEHVDLGSAQTLVGVAGSVTTIGAIAAGIDHYDAEVTHGLVVSATQVHEIAEQLLSQTREERAAIPVMHPGRVDVIGGGALVLSELIKRMNVSEIRISEHDILDGIALSLVRPKVGG